MRNYIRSLLLIPLSILYFVQLVGCSQHKPNNVYRIGVSQCSDDAWRTKMNEEMVLISQDAKEVGEIMATYVGIVRTDLRLKRAWNRLDLLYEETEELFKRSVISRELCELRNIINVGYLIMRQAIERKESRGLHYNIDHLKNG